MRGEMVTDGGMAHLSGQVFWRKVHEVSLEKFGRD
jgi:hypothetical protein